MSESMIVLYEEMLKMINVKKSGIGPPNLFFKKNYKLNSRTEHGDGKISASVLDPYSIQSWKFQLWFRILILMWETACISGPRTGYGVRKTQL
jgi:hypothetical protein